METLRADFGNIAAGLFVTSIGSIAVVIALFRLRNKDFSLLNFGFFCLIYGVRWLAQSPTMKALVGFPFTIPYFEIFLTYIVGIPMSAFLVEVFGPGLFNSILWVYRSIIAYTVVVLGLDLLRLGISPGPLFNPFVVVLWCIVWAANLLFMKRRPEIELTALRTAFSILLISVAHDQIVNMRLLPWTVHFEHVSFLLFCIGLGFVAVHHFFSNERKLLTVEQEIAIARRIQYSNLPETFGSRGGVEIAARYVPMSTVAGDFYDIHYEKGKGVGILIADVSGHGVGAALIGSMLKIAYASQTDHLSDPAKVLTEINRILQGKIENSFVTACAVFIDTAKRRILYANAGHPPPLLLSASRNQKQRLSIGGTILGPFPDSSYDNGSLDYAKDDRLVLYTDGIIEAGSKTGELFGQDRMETFFEAHSSDSADRTSDQLLEHLRTWSGRLRESSYEDDLTLVVMDIVAQMDS